MPFRASEVRLVLQECEGILDVVITRVDDTLSVVDVICNSGGASDHQLVTWPFVTAPAEIPVYKTQLRRSWRQFDPELFRSDLATSCLCNGTLGPPDGASMEEALWFNEVIADLHDAHAPMAEITCCV